jgi:hypothetical protein
MQSLNTICVGLRKAQLIRYASRAKFVIQAHRVFRVSLDAQRPKPPSESVLRGPTWTLTWGLFAALARAKCSLIGSQNACSVTCLSLPMPSQVHARLY